MGKTPEERIEVGDEAARLLNSPLFNSVVAVILADTMNRLISQPVGSEGALTLHAQLRGMNSFKEHLKSLENDAAMARNELKKLR